jgi:hypothetical protein
MLRELFLMVPENLAVLYVAQAKEPVSTTQKIGGIR